MKTAGLILFITIIAMAIFSCSKDDVDTTAPVITMLGKNPDTVIVKTVASYNDPGATALDDKDGNITNKIVVATNVNVNVVNHYLVYYDVEDKFQNLAEKKTRVVEVVSAAGNYDATSTCIGNATDSVMISAYSNNDSIIINNFYQSGTVIKAGLSNFKYVLVPITLTGGIIVNGDITASGTTLNGNYSLSGTGSGSCTSTFIRH
jgi:hypothetical protein